MEPDIIFPSFHEYTETSEKTLPHCLPWDEIEPVKYAVQTTFLRQFLPALRDFAGQFMAQNPDFAEYAAEVKAYGQLREQNDLPLEINARRDYRAREHHSAQMIRRFQPKRSEEETEEAESLKSDEEVLLGKKRLPQEDVVLDASLAIMGKAIQLDQREGYVFSIK